MNRTLIKGSQIRKADFIKSEASGEVDWSNDADTASMKAIASLVSDAEDKNHTVISKNLIVTDQKGKKIHDYTVRCDLNGEQLKIADMSEFAPSSIAFGEKNFVWAKSSGETGRYMGIGSFRSISCKYVFKLDINDSTDNKIKTHLFGLLVDTPPDSTFTFVTTCEWNIVVKVDRSNRLFAFMQIPDDFVGTVVLTPMRSSLSIGAGGSNPSSFDYETGTTTPHYYSWISSTGTVSLNTITEFVGSDVQTGGSSNSTTYIREPFGKYNVNVIGDFGGNLAVNSKIPNAIVNDYFLHTLERRIDFVREENANVQADWNETDATDPSFIQNKPTIPTVNNATLTIQKNGTTIDTFKANAATDKTIDITVPTTAADVSALPSSTKYGASLSLSVNSSTFVVTAQLKDQDGNNLGSAGTIDLPLESVVVSGSYDSATKKVILTLQNGSTVEFSVADLVAGLQSEITAQNPLSADLVTNGTTNKVFTATEQGKLAGIEAGAEVNVQSDWNQTDNTADDFIKNKPTIPTVNDAELTIQVNERDIDTFTANASVDKKINIPIPIEVIYAECTYVSGTGITCELDPSVIAYYVYEGKCVIIKYEKRLFHVTLANDSKTPVVYGFSYNDNHTISRIYYSSYARNNTIWLIEDVTIPAAQVNSDWNASSGVAQILNKPTIPAAQIQSDWNQSDNTQKDYIQNKPPLAAVATSGSYSDLSGRPNVYDSIISFTSNGVPIDSFTVNESKNKTIDIPDKTAWILKHDPDVLFEAVNISRFESHNHICGFTSDSRITTLIDENNGLVTNSNFVFNPFKGFVYTTGGFEPLHEYYVSGKYTYRQVCFTGGCFTRLSPGPVFLITPMFNGTDIPIDSCEIANAMSPKVNKLSVFLGWLINAKGSFELWPEHPIYYCDGSHFRLYSGAKDFTGDYTDLSNIPVLKTNNTTALPATSGEVITGTVNLHKIAKTGTYSDLIGLPTALSDFTNDTNFITLNDVPTEVVYFAWTLSGQTYTSSMTPANILAALKTAKYVIGINKVVNSSRNEYQLYHCMGYVEDSKAETFELFFTHIDGNDVYSLYYDSSISKWNYFRFRAQELLIGTGTGQNIKTINNTSLLGSGNITIHEGDDNVQSDWNQSDSTADDFIKNKPTITDEKVKQTVDATTTEYPLLVSAQSSPTSGTAYESKYSASLKATGEGDVVFVKNSTKCKLRYNSTDLCLNFVFE